MRYLVSLRQDLFEQSSEYTIVSVEEALKILEPMRVVGLDTETEGFDVYTKRLISVQLGNFEYQVMVDCTTIDIMLLKEYLESDRLFLLWNAKFDLKFFYHKRIIIRNVWDGYLAEKILWLGYLPGLPGLGLKDAAMKYLGIELDKTVRGKINYNGLSEEVIIYSCDDVKYLEKIKEFQEKLLKEQELLIAVDVENKFVRVLAYIEYCGVKLDVEKWKAKMLKDEKRLKDAEDSLNTWLINYCDSNPEVKASTVNIVQIPLWTEEEGTNYSADNLRLKIKKRKGARRVPAKDINTSVYKSEAWAVPNKNPWILRQVQGDLFSQTQATAKCLVNWNSSTQVIPVLEHLGFNLLVKDKDTGEMKKSVEAKVIEPQKDKSSIAPIYLEFKAAQKIVSTYGQNFLDQINPKSGRIHTQFQQLMDTGRLSCGGKNKQTKEEYLNLQNIPSDAETRSCFISSMGCDWVSADYQGQESVIIANISEDAAMIEFFRRGKGDLHSLAAKMAYPEHLQDIPLEDVKKKGHHWRQEAKGVEFAINYGGDANTISINKGIPLQEAQKIYDNYMSGFRGMARYQNFRRKDVMDKGYILLNSKTGHKAHIYDYEILIGIKKRFDSQFWPVYRQYKGKQNWDTPPPVLRQIYERFASGEDFEDMTGDYEYIEKDKSGHPITKIWNVGIADVYVFPVKYYFKRKSASEKQSINYPIQGTGALCFKFASIKLFNWLEQNDLLFKVLYTIPVHDEINLECPQEMTKEVSEKLVDCMVRAGSIFCEIIPLGADVSIGDHWIH
jgi:DNA polymerase I-like protein with 3'-5' exonuclease and polymerase domains